MAYVNHWEERGIYRKYSGKLHGDEILEAVQKVEADSRFDTIRYVINDYLDITDIDIKLTNIKIVAAIDSAATLTNPNIILAQVTTNPEVEDVITNYLKAAPKNSYPSKNFTHLDKAREWIVEELTKDTVCQTLP